MRVLIIREYLLIKKGLIILALPGVFINGIILFSSLGFKFAGGMHVYTINARHQIHDGRLRWRNLVLYHLLRSHRRAGSLVCNFVHVGVHSQLDIQFPISEVLGVPGQR